MSKVYEDAIMGNVDSGCDTPVSNISYDDVLGKNCDHEKTGYLGVNCFHIPKNILKKKTLKRFPSTKNKNNYIKNIKLVSEYTDKSNKFILKLKNISIDSLEKYLVKQLKIKQPIQILHIVYNKTNNIAIIKFKIQSNIKYLVLTLNSNQKFNSPKLNDIFTAKEAIEKFKFNKTLFLNIWQIGEKHNG